MSGAGGRESDVPAEPARAPREPAPPLGAWSRLYALVLLGLALTIALCGWLSRIER